MGKSCIKNAFKINVSLAMNPMSFSEQVERVGVPHVDVRRTARTILREFGVGLRVGCFAAFRPRSPTLCDKAGARDMDLAEG